MTTSMIIYLILALFFLSAVIHRIVHRHYIMALVFAACLGFIVANYMGYIDVLPF